MKVDYKNFEVEVIDDKNHKLNSIDNLHHYQKVYFESGKVDSTANPLVVKMTGLVCGVDLRVMSVFFTEKRGQGQSRVEERILSSFKCQG